MKALIYTLSIHESVLDLVHGLGQDIEEICIPDLKLFFNNQACFVLDHVQIQDRLSEVKNKKEFDLSIDMEEKLTTLAKILIQKQDIHKHCMLTFNLKGG